jgi:hypothetical protein
MTSGVTVPEKLFYTSELVLLFLHTTANRALYSRGRAEQIQDSRIMDYYLFGTPEGRFHSLLFMQHCLALKRSNLGCKRATIRTDYVTKHI